MQCVCRYLYLCILHIDIIVCMCNVDVTMLLLNLMPVWFLNIFLCLTSEFLVGQQHTRQWRDVGSVWMSSVSVRCRYMQHCSTGRGRCQLCSTCHAQSAQAAWPRPSCQHSKKCFQGHIIFRGIFSAFPRGGIFSPGDHQRLCWILLTKRAAILLSWWPWWRLWWCSLVITLRPLWSRSAPTVTITLSPPSPAPARGR